MTDSQGRIRQAQALYRSGDQAGARAALAALLKDEPENAEAWYTAALMSASSSQSLKLLRRALYVDPFHERADAMMAQLQSQGVSDEGQPSAGTYAAPTERTTLDANGRPLFSQTAPTERVRGLGQGRKQGKIGMVAAIGVVALALVGLLVVLAGNLGQGGTNTVAIPTLAALPTRTTAPVALPTQPPQLPTATPSPTLTPTLAPYNFTATAYREIERTQASDLVLTGTAAAQTYAPPG